MAKHIGIVACGAEGAALCYRTICVEARESMGEHLHPEITMHTHPLGDYLPSIMAEDWQAVGTLMLSSVWKLAEAGADFVICPDNTLHQAFPLILRGSPIPWIHIADAVAEEAIKREYKCLAITGTKFLMQGPVYPDVLDRHEIAYQIPPIKAMSRINEIIFSQLVYGEFTEESRLFFNEVIQDLKEKGCDAVIFGCTEIPLLVKPEDSPLPCLDSTHILAMAALRKAVK
ncbi:aspartate/glutamate racemase family protein [Candidatus Riflebacteria bacterium]